MPLKALAGFKDAAQLRSAEAACKAPVRREKKKLQLAIVLVQSLLCGAERCKYFSVASV